ncbi:MAG TPA: hypothetical protein VN362_08755 [Xanthobacteraceae bacterium]|jgi:hypothetical protein|nr:hypothetical protein [Xanthobacteraceae bacterium]
MVIVNGYICMNCCDIDKARLGQDPHQTTNQLQKQLERHIDRLDPANFGPAVTFGGSLQGPSAGNGAGGNGTSAAGTSQIAQNSTTPTSSSTVDLIA